MNTAISCNDWVLPVHLMLVPVASFKSRVEKIRHVIIVLAQGAGKSTAMNWNCALIFQGIESMSVLVGSILALISVSGWRKERRYERRADLAGDGLCLAYEAADAIKSIRNPIGGQSEGATRKRMPDETKELARALDDAFTPLERLERHRDLFGKLGAFRYKLMVEFGSSWEDAFRPFFNFHGKIRSLSLRAMRFHCNRKTPHAVCWGEFIKEFDALRWEEDENDPVNNDLQAAVKRLEELCKSIRR